MRYGNICPNCTSAVIRKYQNKPNWKCYRCNTEFNKPIQAEIKQHIPTKKQKRPSQVPSEEHLKIILKQCNDLRTKALASILYLTGARIGEIVKKIKMDHFHVSEENGQQYVIINGLHALKKRDPTKTRRESIIINPRKDAYFWNIIKAYFETIKNKGEFLFNFKQRRGRQLINTLKIYYYEAYGPSNRMWPHLLRHIRAQHLVDEKKYGMHYLKAFFNWSDLRPAETYTKIGFRHLMERETEIDKKDQNQE